MALPEHVPLRLCAAAVERSDAVVRAWSPRTSRGRGRGRAGAAPREAAARRRARPHVRPDVLLVAARPLARARAASERRGVRGDRARHARRALDAGLSGAAE
eukprot:5192746-Prymnesium_polylepis.1